MRGASYLHLPRLFPLVMLAGLGCSVGPGRLAPIRFDYNQAISRSMDQQLLLNLVRLRYRDTPVFLEMNTLVSQYSLTTSAGITPTIVIGGDDEIAPTANIGFSETPTIGYVPLQGQEFATRILSPILPESIILLSDSGWSIERLLRLTVQNINGVQNAVRAAGPTPDTPPEFEVFQQLTRALRELQLEGLLEVRVDPDTEGGSLVRFVFAAPAAAADEEAISAVKSALGISPDVNAFPVVSGSGQAPDALVIRGRSFLAMMFFLSQGVIPPEDDVARGKVTVTRNPDGSVFDWAQVVGDLLTVRSASIEPEDAFVAVLYRDHWFYIEDADLNGKSTFNLLGYLFSLQAATQTGGSPLLTLPAGR